MNAARSPLGRRWGWVADAVVICNIRSRSYLNSSCLKRKQKLTSHRAFPISHPIRRLILMLGGYPHHERQDQDARWRHHVDHGEGWSGSSFHAEHGIATLRVRQASDWRAA